MGPPRVARGLGEHRPVRITSAARREPEPSRLATTPVNVVFHSGRPGVAGANGSSVCGDQTDPHLPVRMPCPQSDSNRHCADFKNGRPARLRPQALSRSMRRTARC
jgi:hypothetical protein